MPNFYNLDDQFEDGIERSTFEHAIDHVITKRFGWSQTVADVVKNKYTDWTKTNDPIENRNQYVHVRFKVYSSDLNFCCICFAHYVTNVFRSFHSDVFESIQIMLFQFFTDLSMIAPTVATASYMHRHHIPVHMYTFNHHSSYADEHWWGSYHSLGKILHNDILF